VVTRGKNYINSVRFFSHKPLVLYLRSSMCTYIYESLNHEVVTIDLHYMTDRHERFDLKISKYCGNKDTYILDALW